MIVFEATGQKEENEVYKALESENGARTYSFLNSAIRTSIDLHQRYLSTTLIKALNFHAVACLHAYAGQYRQHQVDVSKKNEAGEKVVVFLPPQAYRVQALMDDMVNVVNKFLTTEKPTALCAYVFWRLNWIHPFENGNGRTARAASYFILSTAYGGLLPGSKILPELLTEHRVPMYEALRSADKGHNEGSTDFLQPVVSLIEELLRVQLGQAEQGDPPASEAQQGGDVG